MPGYNLTLGRSGEDLAEEFLRKNNYKVLSRNFRTKLGEIDIIAKDRSVICFIEVKTRSSEDFGSPQEAVNRRKQRQITKAALVFLKENKLMDVSARFDIVSVIRSKENPKIELIKNAFELSGEFSF